MSSSSSSATSSTTSASTSKSSRQPNYKTLETLLLSLINLARQVLQVSTHPTRVVRSSAPNADYLKYHAQLSKFCTKNQDFDFVAAGTFGFVFEAKILLWLMEYNLVFGNREVEGFEKLGRGLGEKEWEELKKGVYGDLDGLMFRGMELDVERLPWNFEKKSA